MPNAPLWRGNRPDSGPQLLRGSAAGGSSVPGGRPAAAVGVDAGGGVAVLDIASASLGSRAEVEPRLRGADHPAERGLPVQHLRGPHGRPSVVVPALAVR